MTASKVALQSVGLRDRPEDLIRELYAAAGPLHAEAAPDEGALVAFTLPHDSTAR